MAKNETSTSPDERDSNQRSLGFMGLSAIAHVGVLLAVLLAPSFKSQTGGAVGAQAGTELNYAGNEIADPSAPAAASSSETTTAAPNEVLLADTTDAEAVAMPATQPKEVISEPKVEPKAEPVAVKQKAAQPEIAKAPIQTSSESDVEIKAALEKARAEKVVEKPPEKPEELPAELDAPVMDEEKVAEKSEDNAAEEKPEAHPAEEAVATQEPVAEPVAEEVKPVAAPALVAQTAPLAEKPSIAPPASAAAPSTTTSGTTTALQAPNANGSGTLGRSGGGETSLGSNGANSAANSAPGVGAGSAIRDVSDLVAMPGNPKPTYPLQDKMSGKQGTTVLIGQVKADGTVTGVAVEKSSGSFQMDRAAAQAFAKWRFRPGQAGAIRSPFQFQLVGDAKEMPARLRTQ